MLQALAVLAFTCLPSAGGGSSRDAAVALGARPAPEFEPNAGRWPDEVRFHARAGAVDAWLARDGWWLALRGDERRAVALRMTFEDRRASEPAGCDPAPGRRSYFFGSDPSRWIRSAVAQRAVRWNALAPGVDVVMRADASGFEYDLVLAADAELDALRLRCAGHERFSIAADGSLEIATALGVLRQPRPTAWEIDASGARRELACSYRIDGASTFGFELPGRTRGLVAVIDPALRWSTYLGGSGTQTIESVAAGPNGSVIVGGSSDSIDFPTTPGAYEPLYQGLTDGFVSCLSGDGSQLLWSTALGGGDDDLVRSLAVDVGGAVVVGGDTKSNGFPTVAGSFDTSFGAPRDGFLVRLSPQGDALEWSAFVGGNKSEWLYALALDPQGEVAAVGSTQGGTFPATGSAYDTSFNGGTAAGDAFVVRVSDDGSQLEWASYLGGGGNQLASSVAFAPSGDVVLAGVSYGGSFPLSTSCYDPTFAGASEAFVAALDGSGAILRFCTYLGGSADDEIHALAVRPAGEVLCVGTTSSANFVTTSGALDTHFAGASEGFVAELGAAGSFLVRSTLFGGGKTDAVTAIALDPSGLIVIGGDTLSTNLSMTEGCYGPFFHANTPNTEADTFVARLTADLGALQYATYFGSANDDHLTGLVLDGNGEALLAGTTRGPNFPTTPGALQPSYNVTSTLEGFVARLAFWLHPISFGAPKLNSFGNGAQLIWDGFPSVSDADFRIGVDIAMPLAWTAVFRGNAVVNWPFAGGRLRVRPPLVRMPRFKTDAFGYGIGDVALAPWMAGQTLYFQGWYQDDADIWGGCLTDALRVLVYP